MKYLLTTLLLLASLCNASPALAQGGWDTVKKPELGLTYKMARDYEAIPVDPLEPWEVLIYLEEIDKDPKKRKKTQPRLSFTIIDHNFGVATPTTTDGEAEEEVEVEVEEEVEEEQEPDKKAGPPPINNFERYFEQRWSNWGLGLSSEGKTYKDYDLTIWDLEPKKGKFQGTAYVYSSGNRSVVVIGTCARDDHEDQRDIWDAIALKMKVIEPDSGQVDKERQKMLDAYNRKGYLDPEFRVKARMELPKGW
ncbi:MAG: hypothetical protein ACJAVJ_002426, partial [Planctomycetota bacterium]